MAVAELKERGITCSRQRVARIMKNHNIQAKMHKKFRRTTKRSDHLNFKPQDLLARNFTAHHPNTVWVADTTYLSVNKKWAYLAVVLDLFSRKIVGMALADHMKTDLILAALQQALTLRSPLHGLIHHSDLGSQYTSHGLQNYANKHGISLSYGNSAYDNAVMESFFHTLKTELTHFKTYQTLEEAKLDIFTYIFTFYNKKRRHSTLQYQSPSHYEHNYYNLNSVSVLDV